MRLLQVAVLLIAAASTSATIGALEGVAGGAAALGKSLIGLIGSSLVPVGIFFPLALVGSLKALIGVKALALLKLKLAAPIVAPVALGAVGKAAFAGHVKAHLIKTAAVVKVAVVEVPLKMMAVKAGAIHGAIAGAKIGYASYPSHSVLSAAPAAIIGAAVPHTQPLQEPVPQPEPETPSYGGKPVSHISSAPAYVPPAPEFTPPAPVEATQIADVPASPAYRKRREAETEDGEAIERAIGEVFDTIKQEDDDFCVRRSFCAIAVQPDLAKNFGSEVISAVNNLSDDQTAPWYPYKQAMASGEKEKSLEACAREYPTCTKDVQALIADAVQQFE